jgi:hypothetical protein
VGLLLFYNVFLWAQRRQLPTFEGPPEREPYGVSILISSQTVFRACDDQALGGPASRRRVMTCVVVVVVVFTLFVRSLSLSVGFVLFLCRSVGFDQWGSISVYIGVLTVVRSIRSTLHITPIIDRPPPPILR